MATVRILKIQLTCLLYTVTVNVKKVLIKMKWEDKNIFVPLYIGGQKKKKLSSRVDFVNVCQIVGR
jgi:hypothetical protein